jgi:hypothetical protein
LEVNITEWCWTKSFLSSSKVKINLFCLSNFFHKGAWA